MKRRGAKVPHSLSFSPPRKLREKKFVCIPGTNKKGAKLFESPQKTLSLPLSSFKRCLFTVEGGNQWRPLDRPGKDFFSIPRLRRPVFAQQVWVGVWVHTYTQCDGGGGGPDFLPSLWPWWIKDEERAYTKKSLSQISQGCFGESSGFFFPRPP